MIKILVADDHAVVREGLKQIISESKNLAVKSEAKDGFEVLEKAVDEEIDVLVMDISMPKKSGLEVLKELKEIRPNLPVLILSVHPEDRYGVRVLKAGAKGYLTKESAPKELISAIEKIYNGGKYITESLTDRLVNGLGVDSSQPPHSLLSDREYQIMILLASGKSVKQIASELNISVPSISTYRSRILEKMNLKSNSEITYYAIKNGLVD